MHQQVQCQCQVNRPVVETSFRPEQYVTTRNVTEIQQHQEAYTRLVPTSRQVEVTVDEGHYQTVWVSKPVRKQLTQTTLEQRTEYRTVNRPVTRTISQVQTRMVPQRTVRYIPQSTRVVFNRMPYPGAWTMNGMPQATTVAAPLGSPLVTTAVPGGPIIPSTPELSLSLTNPTSDGKLAPDPALMDTPTIDVMPSGRSVDSNRLGGYEVEETSSSQIRGMFVPAPSAAAVWNSRFLRR